ncbi:MAG: UPF0182 family protein [Chloroflexi bacterium]|nr:UPF0182 family protein [Chloroflexota bacterium]MCI0574749.1 UPF0182 family protein [Chloroflexota bacterium]MCI0645682.1 UPF0182 family protein [Chloroflexota bacterium]MCI0726500.1 UPF0182 family protein [Chloroflexota bacterium]
MDRDILDIPEVFRRAFEEEWEKEEKEGGEGDDGGKKDQGRGRPWWANRWLWLLTVFLILLLSFNWLVTTYTNWLWFTALGYRQVWLRQWTIRVAVFILFFVVAAAVLLVNWRVAYGQARRTRQAFRLRLLELPGVNWLVTAGALFLAFVLALMASGRWQQLLLYIYRAPFGRRDPVFNLDLSFYLFELPVYRFLQNYFAILLMLTLLGVAGLFAVDNWPAAQRGQWRPQQLPALRRQVALLATLLFLLWAAGLWLDVYELMYSTRGVAFGASYTDLHAVRPALYAQLVLVLLLALATAVNFFRLELRPLLLTGALWLLVAVFAGNLYPALLQRYSVEPNELAREAPYIEQNIAFTRLAFGLDQVDTRPFGDLGELDEQDLAENRDALQNVRLWDYRPLQQTYAQLQELRPYYTFSSIDIDRYELDGEVRQVMLAGRELDPRGLTAPSWVNRKLEFTHGYGVVMNPVDQITPEGQPFFFIKDLPPASTVPLEVERPEIYFGEMMEEVVFVGSRLEEFDYPSGNENVYSSYSGRGGVVMDSPLKRLAFAFRFGETNLLLSQYITGQTQVIFYRQISDRVRQIAPFLELDNDPYLVVADGRLVWMLDAYTLSDHFPYATPTERGHNYIRNAAKITVDAYDGTVTYYLAAPQDPLIQAYARAFPGLFHPLEEMPAALQVHIRYPEDLFTVQAQQYLKYHMTSVQVFYNQEDLWQIPHEIVEEGTEQPIEAYYVILSLPDEGQTEYLLIQPYSPAGKNNMVGWMAARNDPAHYGELVVYELPKQELAFGPIQIEARINQDTLISQQLTLWNQLGSRVIRGNLIVIPMNDSFLYVEPLYLLAETSELPELKRVILATGNRIVMRETLNMALAALIEGAPSVDEVVAEEPPAGDQTEPETAPPLPAGATVEALVQSANAHLQAAEEAQRNGDWATYGRELEALRQDLGRLAELTGGNE